MKLQRIAPTAFALLLTGASLAGQDYTLTPQWETKDLKVSVKIPKPSGEFWMPAWREGDYQLFQYGKTVSSIRFLKDGREVPGTLRDTGRWQITGGADEVEYVVQPSAGNFSPNLRVSPGELWVSGPVFGVFGSQKGKHRVSLAAEESFQLYTSLPSSRKENEWSFVAADYQELLDSPFLLSNRALSAKFEVANKEHEFVCYGRTEGVEAEGFANLAQRVVIAAHELFGELPYKRYVFFGDFYGGYGGLEHRASTRLGLRSPQPDTAASLISHEYFHCFNVKQIIPSEFRDFDFSKPAETDSLWWLEGVTDYYSVILLRRAGVWTEAQARASVGRSIWALERGNAKNKVTLKDSSRKVWLNTGSQGFGGLSYYLKGKVAGFALDLAIREESKGKKSLDDVLMGLFKESRKQKGYSPTRIRELVKEAGGPKSEALYVQITETTQDIPWDSILRPCGFMIGASSLVETAEISEAQRKARNSWPF